MAGGSNGAGSADAAGELFGAEEAAVTNTCNGTAETGC